MLTIIAGICALGLIVRIVQARWQFEATMQHLHDTNIYLQAIAQNTHLMEPKLIRVIEELMRLNDKFRK